MPKIQCGAPILQLNGEQMRDGNDNGNPMTIGHAIASIFANGTRATGEFGSFKSYVLALDFFKKDEVVLDEADFRKLVIFLTEDTTYPAIITGQIIAELNNVEDREKAKDATAEKSETTAV